MPDDFQVFKPKQDSKIKAKRYKPGDELHDEVEIPVNQDPKTPGYIVQDPHNGGFTFVADSDFHVKFKKSYRIKGVGATIGGGVIGVIYLFQHLSELCK